MDIHAWKDVGVFFLNHFHPKEVYTPIEMNVVFKREIKREKKIIIKDRVKVPILRRDNIRVEIAFRS